MKRKPPPLTQYERQLRAAIRDVIRSYDDHWECPYCWRAQEDEWGCHAPECIVTLLQHALRRPK